MRFLIAISVIGPFVFAGFIGWLLRPKRTPSDPIEHFPEGAE